MKTIVLIIAVICLTGCGVAKYKITAPDGTTAEIFNTKDIESVSVIAKKNAAGDYSFKFEERGVRATDPIKAMSMQAEVIRNIVGKLGQ